MRYNLLINSYFVSEGEFMIQSNGDKYGLNKNLSEFVNNKFRTLIL